jgi:flagellin
MGFQSGFRINTNTSAVNTYRSYSSAQAGLERNIERLSSGLRINRAADDSAGLAISQRMNNQIKGMQQANRNVQQGNNMLQTAEGGLNQIHSILGRMRELAVQSASDGLNADDRASIDLEFQQLKSEISRIGNGTEYNGMTLINGDRAKNLTTEDNSIGGNMINDSSLGSTKVASFAANGDYTLQAQKPDGSGGFTAATTLAEATQFTLTVGSESQTVARAGDQGAGFDDVDGSQINFDELGIVTDTSGLTTGAKSFSVDDGNYMTIQVGANNDADHSAANPGATENRITFNLADATSEGLAIDGIDLDSLGDAQSAINSLDAAIQKVNDERSNIGALQNRFEYTSSNLMNSIQNNSASLSTIQDADFAVEAADLARNQILTQSSSAMLAQANQISQNVLGLLR